MARSTGSMKKRTARVKGQPGRMNPMSPRRSVADRSHEKRTLYPQHSTGHQEPDVASHARVRLHMKDGKIDWIDEEKDRAGEGAARAHEPYVAAPLRR